jgi:hypothetical protein
VSDSAYARAGVDQTRAGSAVVTLVAAPAPDVECPVQAVGVDVLTTHEARRVPEPV